MSILDWFAKQEKPSQTASQKLNIPHDLWVKCFQCHDTLFLKDLENNRKVCTKCQYHFRLSPEERLQYFFDAGSFQEYHKEIRPVDPLTFSDTEPYSARLKKSQKKTGRLDGAVVGTATLKETPVNVGLLDFNFMGGSMGSVVGEKLTRLIELACQNKEPLIIFSTSGGARMQEGLFSLMQMAKTSAALYLLDQAKVPYISVLCDPTTGGTSASFAMLGDINLAEPGALISFAGPRVIEQTIRQKLPPGFQRSEFLRDHGMVDRVVHRKDLTETLFQLITLLSIPKKSPS